MSKLFVAGCSFSDYTKVSQTYGEILADKLNRSYIHEGAGCGSNWRIWRVITQYVLNKELTKDDLLIIQYTNTTRTEFYSPYPNKCFKSTKIQVSLADKSYNNGSIIRYKLGASEWQKYPEEKEFFDIYEKTFLNEKFENEKFEVHNYNFQIMLQNHGIPTIFLDTFRIIQFNNYVIDYFKKYQFKDLENVNSSQYNLTKEDSAHMNQRGHADLATRLLEHIEKTGIIGDLK